MSTLEITSGDLICGPAGECPHGLLRGTDFTINYFNLGDCGAHCSSFFMDLGTPGVLSVTDAIVTVGTDTCHHRLLPIPGQPNGLCGGILLTPIGTPDPSGNFTLPFVANGHLTVGDGFDIIGGGTMESTLDPFSIEQHWTFTAVPEPSTVLLLILGVISFAVQRWFTWRRA
jgi:hypothetical protein